MGSFVVYIDYEGEFRWYLMADNQRIAESAGSYRSRNDCEDSIRHVKRRASKATIESKTKPVETLISN